MSIIESIQHGTQWLQQQVIRPFIRGATEYINTLYYTNQLVAYALGIITVATKDKVNPMTIAISVPVIAIALCAFFVYTKKYPPQKGSYLYSFQRMLFHTQLFIYGNIPSILCIATLSSVCLVLSFEALLLHYSQIIATTVQMTAISTCSAIAAIAALKLWELIANLPIIRKIKQELNSNETTEDKNDIDPINTTQEQYKIILHCCNFFISFVTNSLTVILALASAATTALSAPASIAILAAVSTLAILSCLLVYQKHQNKIQSYSTQLPEYAPTSLPSDDLIRDMGTIVADTRAKLDNIFALMQLGGLNL